MARTIRTIEAVASSTGMEVDRDAGIIHGVKILGLVSDNNRKYMPEAVRKAKSLYEGIKVNIDHPAESGDVRSAEDRFGKLINVKYVEGEGLYGDLMFLKSHPMAERICEAAERNDMNDTFGLSHNAQGDGQEDDQGCFVVSSIVEVRHVDLVADPATTKSLREARTRMKAKVTEGSDQSRKNLSSMTTSRLKELLWNQFSQGLKKNDYDKINSRRQEFVNRYNAMSKEKLVDELIKSEGWKESDMRNDEDEEMTEATNFDDKQLDWIRKNVYDASKMGKVKTLAKTAQAAISEINKWLMVANQNHSGPKTAATFGHYRDALTSVPVNSTLSDLANLDPSKYINNDAFSESKSKMKEAEDMPDDEEMAEAVITNRFKSSIANRLDRQHVSKDVLMKFINDGKIETDTDIEPRRSALFRDLKTNERFTVFVEAEGSNKEPGVEVYGTKGMKNTKFRKTFKSQKDYEKWYDQNKDDVEIDGVRDLEEEYACETDDALMEKPSRDEEMPEAEDMPVEDPSEEEEMTEEDDIPMEDPSEEDETSVESYDEEDDMPVDEADDEYTDDEDKMAMESKQYRKLQQFCKKNNVAFTKDLYKDLKPLTETAQQRCVLRIKLAAKARKPKSSGSIMPMTESKVHTGDNVFNWLRS